MQQRFRAHIQRRIDALNLEACDDDDLPADDVQRIERVLMLLRKLREGIIASRRSDAFAVEAYETSALLALRIRNHPQLVSSLGVLVPGLYASCEAKAGDVDLASAVGGLSLDHKSPSRKPLFASLLLIYRLAHQNSPTAFWKSWMELTAKGASFGISSETPHGAFCLLAYRAVIRPDPLLYRSLLRTLATAHADPESTPHDLFSIDDRLHLRRALLLAEDRICAETERWVAVAYGRSGTSDSWKAELLGMKVHGDDRRRKRDERTAKALGLLIPLTRTVNGS